MGKVDVTVLLRSASTKNPIAANQGPRRLVSSNLRYASAAQR